MHNIRTYLIILCLCDESVSSSPGPSPETLELEVMVASGVALSPSMKRAGGSNISVSALIKSQSGDARMSRGQLQVCTIREC